MLKLTNQSVFYYLIKIQALWIFASGLRRIVETIDLNIQIMIITNHIFALQLIEIWQNSYGTYGKLYTINNIIYDII